MNQDVSTNQTVTSQPPQPTTSSKKKYESVWRAALSIILILVSFIIKKIYVFQTDQHFESVRLANIWDICLYGLLFALVFSGFDWLVHYTLDDLCDRHYLNHDKYASEEDRKKRSYTLVKWGYSIVYYLLSSIWCLRILMETTYLPVWLGGKGDPFTYLLNKLLVSEITFEMKVFYILQFGKHFSRFFGHVFIRSEGNFFEYALHHGLSVFLILYSYLTNFWLPGMMVLLLHDYSDFALIMARAYRDYRHVSKRVLDAIYVHAFIFWVGCRILLFNYTCIFPAVNCILKGFPSFDEFELSVMGGPFILMTFMMIMLEILHLFWTYYIAESFISVKVSPTIARHSYD